MDWRIGLVREKETRNGEQQQQQRNEHVKNEKFWPFSTIIISELNEKRRNSYTLHIQRIQTDTMRYVRYIDVLCSVHLMQLPIKRNKKTDFCADVGMHTSVLALCTLDEPWKYNKQSEI